MDGALALRVVCALLLGITALLKANAPTAMASSLRRFGLSGTTAGRATWMIICLEAGLAVGLLLPGAWVVAVAGVAAWTAGAVVYLAVSLASGIRECGCLGGWDPLRRFGATRRLIYLAPIAFAAALLVGATATMSPETFGLQPSVLLAWITGTGLVAVGPMFVGTAGRDKRSRRHTEGQSSGRRAFLRWAGGSALAVALAPLVPAARVLAQVPCGAWSCVRYYIYCICCGTGGAQSCDGCYRYVCRWCYSAGNGYQQCGYVSPGWCYANICTTGRRYQSNCGCCSGYPV